MKNTVVEARYLGNRGRQRLAHLQPQRSEHLRERVPAGIQERAAEPRDQRAGGRHELREPAACRGRCRCRCSTRRSARAARSRRSRPARATRTPAFITQLRTGRGRRAGRTPRRATSIYLCRMVGSTFIAVRARAATTRAGPVSDQRLPRRIRSRSQRRSRSWTTTRSTRLSRAAAAAAAALLERASAQRELHARARTPATSTPTTRRRQSTTARCATSRWTTARRPSTSVTCLQTFGTYDSALRRDRHFSIDNAVLDAIVGGWTFGGILTAQSGTPFRLSSGRQTVNGSDSGVVLMNGLTVEGPAEDDQGRARPRASTGTLSIAKLIGPDGRANPEYLRRQRRLGSGQLSLLCGTPNSWTLDALAQQDDPARSVRRSFTRPLHGAEPAQSPDLGHSGFTSWRTRISRARRSVRPRVR